MPTESSWKERYNCHRLALPAGLSVQVNWTCHTPMEGEQERGYEVVFQDIRYKKLFVNCGEAKRAGLELARKNLMAAMEQVEKEIGQ